ncbi:hypothetical protein GIB67_029576 [Kingdonia uniflora]|uniref:Uncharacterized protein n=1 Tax=Kingdonia uniflora TaxID=39325 RepID=A0A7J7LL96_9MAGN|nr:hypothetical protein GIB67_029576 [Kingdonia uniflora]
MASISGCAKADEADLVGHLSPVIGVGDEEDTVAELIEWPRLKGARVEYPTGSSRFRGFCNAKSSIDGIWGHAFAYWEKKCRRLGDEVSLEYVQGVVKDSRTDGFCCYLAQFDYGLTLPLSNLTKSVMNLIRVCLAQLNYNFWEVIFVYETLNGRWAASCSEKRITVKDFLEYYAVKYVTGTNAAYLCSSSRSDEEPLKLNSITITKGINCKVSRKKSFINVIAREGTELEVVLKELEISRFKRVSSKDDKVRRSQAKRRLVGKTLGSMEEKLTTSELNIPLKLTRLNDIPDGPVNMATVFSTAVRNLAKRKAVNRGAAPRSVHHWTIAIRGGSLLAFRGTFSLVPRIGRWSWKKRSPSSRERKPVGREADSGEGRFPVGITAFSERNYEEMEIMDEEEVEEMEGGLNTAEKTDADNQETINQEIENSCLRVVDLEGLLEVEKKSSAELQKELDTAREKEKQTLLYNAEYAEEYEALISQYEDQLDDNVKLSFKLEESKRQVEEKTATILSRDLALNQLTSKLAELKEKAMSGSRHEVELAEYRIRALNEEISDMKCNICALNELVLKREINLDTALDRLKADLRRLKGKEAQSRADLVEIQAKNQNLVVDLAHARGNVRRATQHEKEMNKIINQLCARISESERELRVRELKYQKDLKFELDKRDCEIASGEGSREMKEFLHRKEELVENMRIDLANSQQKSIDLTRQMSKRIDQLTAELAESKARRLKDNKRAAITHQALKELLVHEQEKCDGEVFHQRQLSALVTFFVEEIKFLQVERDLMQDCFSGRTCVSKLDISSIDPIGVMDRGIGTTTAEHIARGREIVTERAPEYMPSRTEIGGSSSVVSPTSVVGGRSSVVSPTPVEGGRSAALPSSTLEMSTFCM